MTGISASRVLRTSLRIAFTAFAIGLLLGLTTTMASAASASADTAPTAFAAEHHADNDSPPAPTTPGGLTTCPEGADCSPKPVDPKPAHDTSGDLTACPKWQKCDPPTKDPGGLTTCPEDQDCDPPSNDPGGLTTCPEDQDCSPSEEPTEPSEDTSEEPTDTSEDTSGDPTDGDDRADRRIPVPTRIDTGMGGSAPATWSWSLLADVLLALAAGTVGAYAGVRL